MIIGRVYTDVFEKDGKEFQVIRMDIRTISFRKKMTIAVNREKWAKGNPPAKLTSEISDAPDYFIWANFSGRGESIPSQVVGHMFNRYGEDGSLVHKDGVVFDPAVSGGELRCRLQEVAKDQKIDANDLYRVVWEQP